MGSIQSAILGFGVFKGLERCGILGFTAHENVVCQTAVIFLSSVSTVLRQPFSQGVAAASMPLAGGFFGPLFAIEQQMGLQFSTGFLIVWGLGLAFFGAFLAVPLRRQTILVEKLKFPSGTGANLRCKDNTECFSGNAATAVTIQAMHQTSSHSSLVPVRDTHTPLLLALIAAFLLKTLFFFIPALENLPVGSWMGVPAVSDFGFTLYLSLGHLGQGMIMGFHTTNSLLLVCRLDVYFLQHRHARQGLHHGMGDSRTYRKDVGVGTGACREYPRWSQGVAPVACSDYYGAMLGKKLTRIPFDHFSHISRLSSR